ncbi:MAG: hypothetical protein IH804_04740, partial [Planctomycetes bacterium]|nr:hypothetical protein [Planctomycetota bacterium]
MVLLSAVAARGQTTARRELFGASRDRPVAVAADPTVTRSRAAFLRMRLLATVEPGERLVLNLFDDTRLVMHVEGVERSAPDRLHLRGRIGGDGGGRFNLVQRADVVTGLIKAPGVGTYRLRFDADGRGAIQEIDEDLLPGCENGPAQFVAGGAGGGGVARGHRERE